MTEEERRQRNRERMPTVAAFVDAMREAFGHDQILVNWASENGHEIGNRPKNRGLYDRQ